MAVLLVHIFHLDIKLCLPLSLSLSFKTLKMFVFRDTAIFIQDLFTEHLRFARHSSKELET